MELIETLKEKITKLEHELVDTQTKVQELLAKKELTPPVSDPIYSYFTYTTILNYLQPASHLILGNYHIKNLSNQPMKSPLILLKFDSKTEFNFSGKYRSPQQDPEKHQFQWERIMMEDLDPVTHYCFKPTQQDELLPNEQLNFTNFQIVIPKDVSLKVIGFTYFNESNDGMLAINSIDISI